jgi:hypothetical protein
LTIGRRLNNLPHKTRQVCGKGGTVEKQAEADRLRVCHTREWG